MLLRQIKWSHDEAGTFYGAVGDWHERNEPCHYTTHKCWNKNEAGQIVWKYQAVHTSRPDYKHTVLGTAPTEAKARAICQAHWDQNPLNKSDPPPPPAAPATQLAAPVPRGPGFRYLKNSLGNHTFLYDTVADLVKFCNPTLYEKHWGSSSFAGEELRSWDEVKHLVDKGYEPAVKVVKDFLAKLQSVPLPDVKDHRRRTRFNDSEGDELDLDRLRDGQPFWRQSKREETTGPVEVTIITDISANAYCHHNDALWRGAAAIALTQILEARGYAVELWVIEGTRPLAGGYNQPKILSACNLKRPGETVDTSSLVCAVTAWFYRTVDFTVVKTQAGYCHEPISDVGGAYTPVAADLDAVTPDRLRIYSSSVFDFNAAVAMVRAELDRINEHHLDN